MRFLVSGERNFSRFLATLSRRGEAGFTEVEGPVREILDRVKRNGDTALFDLTRKYDRWTPSARTVKVSRREMDKAVKSLSREEKATLKFAAERIERFHSLQIQRSWSFAEEDGTILGQIVRPIGRAGIYVPGGKAAYPSSVLMNAIPARVAGVQEIIMASPALEGRLTSQVVAAARIAGVDEIFKIGGAQAIGAMAYGTESVPRVEKIVGPGNIYVATAKRLVFGEVSIDSIAGPSEILIISDGSGDPAFIAADLLSQAEHDEQAAAILLCTDKKFAEAVRKEIPAQLGGLPRQTIAAHSLRDFGAILVVKSLAEAVKVTNELAPEHLELAVKEPWALLDKIENAGAVFLGHLSPEAYRGLCRRPQPCPANGRNGPFLFPPGSLRFHEAFERDLSFGGGPEKSFAGGHEDGFHGETRRAQAVGGKAPGRLSTKEMKPPTAGS